MDYKAAIQQIVADSIQNKLGVEDFDGKKIVIKPSVKPEFGDLSTPAAMGLARQLKKAPLQIAKDIIEGLPAADWLEKAEAVPPGFINFWLAGANAAAVLKTILTEKDNFGTSKKGDGKKVMVEFVSANPTGPLHVGHGRNAIVGDCICRLLTASSYEVYREYYYNNAGVQINTLGKSMRARYLQVLGEKVEFEDSFYKGSYVGILAEQLKSEVGDSKKDADLEFFSTYAAENIMNWINEDLASLDIHFDNYFLESSLFESGAVEDALQQLKDRDMSYEKDGATWLKTAQFGDTDDRVLIKSDGTKTYMTPDIAYHLTKSQRGFDRAIDLFGHDHHGYIQRLKAGIKALGFDDSFLDVITYQMLNLVKDGEEVKMSTRGGEFITIKELIEEFSADVFRYFMIMRSYDSQFTFDWNLATDTSDKNPLYKIQYAHARCCSLKSKAEEQGLKWIGVDQVDLGLLKMTEEKELMKLLNKYPDLVDRAARELQTHFIPNYLTEVSNALNSYYAKGNDNEDARVVLIDQPELTQARLALVQAIRQVLKNGLGLLGISAPERM